MCGRYALTHSPTEVAQAFGLAALDGFPPRYNIAPTQPILIVIGGSAERPDAQNGEARSGLLVRWGLIPSWTKDPASMPLLFNARAESAPERAAFKGAIRHRRCIVPASAFYEWRKREGGPSEPHLARRPDGSVLALAALMETYLAPDGSEIDTAAILTTDARGPLAAIHPRMPVLVEPIDLARWLDCRNHAPDDVSDILHAADAPHYEITPVSDRVNAVANMDPSIQDAVSPAADVSKAPEQGSFGF